MLVNGGSIQTGLSLRREVSRELVASENGRRTLQGYLINCYQTAANKMICFGLVGYLYVCQSLIQWKSTLVNGSKAPVRHVENCNC